MADLFSMLEAGLTYINVKVLGLEPFHFNLVKTPLLLLGFSIVVWSVFIKSSADRVSKLVRWFRGLSCGRLTFVLSALLTILLSYFSLKQFYSFTAEAYDLGIYSNSLWHTVHGEWFFDSLKDEHLLGDHFGPVLIVFAPLYCLWESPVWLLIIQTTALGLGGVAVGLLAHRVTGSSVKVFVMLLLYVSNPYLHSVAALDFHPIALGIPVFLWMLYCLDTERYWAALALASVALLVEESLAPGLVGVGVYLFFFRPQYRRTGLVVALLGALWFVVEVTVFLPHFSQSALIHWDRYANLGPDFPSALYNIATDPLFLVTEAFVRDYKIYYLAALLVSVGFLPLLAWRQASLIVLPALMMLLSQNEGHYKFGFHYSAAVLPFLFYSAAYGIASVSSLISTRLPVWAKSERIILAVTVTLLTINVYQIRGYRLSNIDDEHVTAIQTVLEAIPARASVRAEGHIVAMLSSRHQIAPLVVQPEKNFEWWVPEYFVMDFKHIEGSATQLMARQRLINHLSQKDRYRLVKEQDGVILFKAES